MGAFFFTASHRQPPGRKPATSLVLDEINFVV
jgi:hypothetical protein